MPNFLANIDADFSSIVDGLVAATLKPRNTQGGWQQDVMLQHVRCRPLSRKEMEASAGKVRQGDCIFYWPLAESPEPPLGSRLVFKNETWTLLAIDRKELIDVYQVIARNLAIEAGLDCKATVLKATYAKGAAGDAKPIWTVIAKDIPARFQPLTEDVAQLISAEWTRGTFRVILGENVPLEPDSYSQSGASKLTGGRYRLMDSAGNHYRVTHYTNQDRIDTLPVAIAVRINEGAESFAQAGRRGVRR